MNGRKWLVFTSLLLAFSVAAPGVAAAKRGGTDRPVKGRSTQTTTVDLATLTATSQGTANISHVGKSTYTLNAQLSVIGPTTLGITGSGTVVAANGDQVFATFTGTATVPSLVPVVGDTSEFTTVFTVTGGTGRFSDASGTLTAQGDQVIVSVVGTTLVLNDTATLRGRVSY